MIQIEIENNRYNVPEGWNELSLGKFIEYYKLSLDKKDYVDTIEYNIRLLIIMTGASYDELSNLYVNELKELFQLISWINIEPITSNKTVFEIDGFKYVLMDNNRIKAKEQITIEYLLKDIKDNTLMFPEILSIILRPAVEYIELGKVKYKQMELEDDMLAINDRANLFREKLMIEEVYGAVVFFSNGDKRPSTKTSGRTSSLKIIRKNQVSSSKKKVKETKQTPLDKNGVGI